MQLTFSANLQWIKADFGGIRHEPVIGLRPMIRFQRYIADWLKEGWDIIILEMALDSDTWAGSANMKFVGPDFPHKGWIIKGELFELLDGDRVIAVGRIEETS